MSTSEEMGRLVRDVGSQKQQIDLSKAEVSGSYVVEKPTAEQHLVRALRQTVLPSMIVQHAAPQPDVQTAGDRPVEPSRSLGLPGDQDANHTAHQHSPEAESTQTVSGDQARGVNALLSALLAGDRPAADAIVATLVGSGVSVASVLIDYVAPVAVKAGAMWAEDECSFTDVTLVTSALSRIVRDLEMESDRSALPATDLKKRCVLFSPADDTHSLGLQIFATLLRLSGWCVTSLPRSRFREVLAVVNNIEPAFVGVSVGKEVPTETWKEWTRKLRGSTSEQRCHIIAGGPGALAAVASDRELGLDYRCQSPEDTTRYLAALWEKMAVPGSTA